MTIIAGVFTAGARQYPAGVNGTFRNVVYQYVVTDAGKKMMPTALMTGESGT
ncbi:MAG: hypothetical protein PVG89_02405 [Gammaproteobacteria bacterium]